MASSDDTLAAARSSLDRARHLDRRPALRGEMTRGAVLGAVASLPIYGIGVIGGAMIGAGVAALDRLTKD